MLFAACLVLLLLIRGSRRYEKTELYNCRWTRINEAVHLQLFVCLHSRLIYAVEKNNQMLLGRPYEIRAHIPLNESRQQMSEEKAKLWRNMWPPNGMNDNSYHNTRTGLDKPEASQVSEGNERQCFTLRKRNFGIVF